MHVRRFWCQVCALTIARWNVLWGGLRLFTALFWCTLVLHVMRHSLRVFSMRLAQASGKENAPAEVEGTEVPSPFTASVWEVSANILISV